MARSLIEPYSLPEKNDDESGNEEEEDAENDAGNGDVAGLATQDPCIVKLPVKLGTPRLKHSISSGAFESSNRDKSGNLTGK